MSLGIAPRGPVFEGIPAGTSPSRQHLAARCVIRRCGVRATDVLDLRTSGGQYEVTLLLCSVHATELDGWLREDRSAWLRKAADLVPVARQ